MKPDQLDLFPQTKEAFDLPDAEIEYFPGLFSVERADALLESLIDKIEWVQNKIRFYGKESLVPRLEAWYGDAGKSYTYSGIRMEPKLWIEELLEIKKVIEPIAETRFNSVLINFYRDGKDRVAWHSDDESEEHDENAFRVQVVLLLIGCYFARSGRDLDYLGRPEAGLNEQDLANLGADEEYQDILRAARFEKGLSEALDYLEKRNLLFRSGAGRYFLSSAGIYFLNQLVQEYEQS